VPVSDVPADVAVKVTVALVSSVTVIVLPERIASLAVAVMLIVDPALYEPSPVVDENELMVGATVSRVIVAVEVVAEFGPVTEFEMRVAPLVAKTGITVPSPAAQPLTVSV
jgi:hypothetical protein